MSLIPSIFGSQWINIFLPLLTRHLGPFQWRPILATASSLAGETSAFTNMRIDWRETRDPLEAHILKWHLRGLKKEDVMIEAEDEEVRVLWTSGKRNQNDVWQWHHIERNSRKFRLPENFKSDQVKANMENAVLSVPKEKKHGEVKVIEISG